MTALPDAVVVGAGIVGASCAYHLAREGMRVLVVDAGVVGGGTTGAGMGHLVVMDDSPAQLEFTSYSQRLWAELASEMPAHCEMDPCGTLWLAEDEDQLAAVHAKGAAYAAHGLEVEVLDAAAVAEAEPNVRPGLAGALRVGSDRVLYPPNAARWLMEQARAQGAELLEGCRVDEIRAGGVTAQGRRIDAGVVVNAAGAEAALLTPGLPIEPRKGHLVITDRYPGFLRHQLVELGYLKSAHTMTRESAAFNLQPRATGQVLIGSTRELVGWDRSINPPLVRRMLERAVEFVPPLAGLSITRTWTGFRPATPDKLPLIGRWGETQGLWIAAGHEGLGITTAPATGRLIADLIVGRPTEIDATPFDPARAGGSRETSDA